MSTFSNNFKPLISFAIFVACIGEELQDFPTVPDFGFTENKTERDQAMEDCMEEYIECIIVDRKKTFCAVNENGKHRQFYNLCEMEYENCRNIEEKWHYLHDDNCGDVKEHKNKTTT